MPPKAFHCIKSAGHPGRRRANTRRFRAVVGGFMEGGHVHGVVMPFQKHCEPRVDFVGVENGIVFF